MTAGATVLDRPSAAETPRPARTWARVESLVFLGVVAACCIFVFVQLEPKLLLRDTTPTGGDTGAHVWWPAYLRDHLLPWRVAGWSPDWYAGFPVGQFYFPFPALLIVGLDIAIPYNVAFKLVTALGPMLLPVGAYVLGRGLRAPKPTPAALAVGATAFLFFTGDPGNTPLGETIGFNQHIMGGNLASTMAGEFSFTLALACALAFLGTYASALRTRRHLWIPALLFAATVTSHLVVGVFAVLGALVIWAANGPLRNLGRAAAVGVVGGLLTAVWTLPLVATLGYTTDMRYEPITHYSAYLFPSYLFEPESWKPWEWGGYALVGIALLAAVIRLRRSTFVLVAMTGLAALGFRFWADVNVTTVWNLRMLPFWYLGVFLLGAVGLAELVRGAGVLAGRCAVWSSAQGEAEPRPDEEQAPDEQVLAPSPLVSDSEAALAPVRHPTFVSRADGYDATQELRLPADHPRAAFVASMTRSAVVALLAVLLAAGALVSIDRGKEFLPYWIRWNYTGYEETEGDEFTGTAKAWDEHRRLIDTLEALPPGRLLWEGGPSLDRYGTPLALMLLPYWTDGRIASMEGVYFEASATTPYHFETVAALVAPGNASNPERGIPYRTQEDFSLGVRYLQMLGVRYFMAHDPETRRRAGEDPRLRLVATSPDLDGQPPETWEVYVVAGAPLVEALRREPTVVQGVAPGDWEQEVGVLWWNRGHGYGQVVTAGGPPSWRRVGAHAALDARGATVPSVRVSRVRTTDDSVSFRVSRPGVPVLVKTSYFPNWHAEGAQGPWRATPNFMVVVPTSRDVRLEYATTTAEWLGRAGTLFGVAGVVALVRWGRRSRRSRDS